MMRFQPSSPTQQSQYGEPVTLTIAILGAVSALGGGGFSLWKSSKDQETMKQQSRAAIQLQQMEAVEAEKQRQYELVMSERRKGLLLLGLGGLTGAAVVYMVAKTLLADDE